MKPTKNVVNNLQYHPAGGIVQARRCEMKEEAKKRAWVIELSYKDCPKHKVVLIITNNIDKYLDEFMDDGWNILLVSHILTDEAIID